MWSLNSISKVSLLNDILIDVSISSNQRSSKTKNMKCEKQKCESIGVVSLALCLWVELILKEITGTVGNDC